MQKMKGKEGFFAIKEGLSKACDKISWESIWCAINEINLLDKLINIIMHAVTSVESNVKWHVREVNIFPSIWDKARRSHLLTSLCVYAWKNMPTSSSKH